MVNTKALINYLKVILGTDDISSDIVSYISSIQHEEDYEEFMENILNKNNSAHLESYAAIRKIIFGHQPQHKTALPSSSTPQEISQSNLTKFNSNNIKQPVAIQKKGKTKFRNINTYQAKQKQKEGRSICDCLGQEHEFMNNCLSCGRIHCMEEGPGPCLFCGNLITVRGDDTYDANSRKTKAGMKHRENKVFDDDNDYFKIKHKKSEQDNKQKMIVALDFASRRVIEGTEEDAKIKERLLQDSVEHLKRVEQMYKSIQKQAERSYHHTQIETVNEDLVNLLIQMRHKKPQGVEDLGVEDSSMPIINYGTKVFDEDLMMNIDHGVCLSMHQPWASLLVAGVKKHEGRSWATNHRGRLWIAATAKKPDNESIEEMETFYRKYYNDETLNFPRNYPTSCLLGCVTINDCLEQEEYRKKYPNGESNSPYVFICSNPIILPIFYPILGKHKIYALDKDLHKCAKMALQHATYVM